MSELAAWLLEQIAEDEAVAKAAKPGPWFANGDDALPEWDWQVGTGTGVIGRTDTFPGVDVRGEVVWTAYEGGGTDQPNAAHIARWDPVRVLAECEAKRRIVTRWEFAVGQASNADEGWEMIAGALEACVLDLALPCADRAGYREEWKP